MWLINTSISAFDNLVALINNSANPDLPLDRYTITELSPSIVTGDVYNNTSIRLTGVATKGIQGTGVYRYRRVDLGLISNVNVTITPQMTISQVHLKVCQQLALLPSDVVLTLGQLPTDFTNVQMIQTSAKAIANSWCYINSVPIMLSVQAPDNTRQLENGGPRFMENGAYRYLEVA